MAAQGDRAAPPLGAEPPVLRVVPNPLPDQEATAETASARAGDTSQDTLRRFILALLRALGPWHT
jgi:hypothetical protein